MTILEPSVNLDIPKYQSLTDFIFSTRNPYQDGATVSLNQPGFIDGDSGETVSHGQVKSDTFRIASGLVNNYHLNRSDVVGIFSPNHIKYPSIFLGALSVGITITTSNPMYTEKELLHQLKDSNAKLIFTTEAGLPLVTSANKLLTKPIPVVVIDTGFKTKNTQVVALTELMCDLPYPKLAFDAINLEDNCSTPALIAYSSGTTGLPKGVITTHHNLIANLMQSEYALRGRGPAGLIVAGVLPFFHCYGIMMIMLQGVHGYFQTVTIKKFDLPKFLSLIEKYKIEYLSLAPPVVLQLAKNPIIDNYNLSSVKMIMSGAAPLPSDVGRKAMERLNCQVFQGYGMTETSPVITVSDAGSKKVESAGALVPNIRAKIVDPDNGKLLDRGSIGELWVKGPNIMMGYLNNPKATRDMFDSEGFMRTGDIGYFDKELHLFLVDRAKELIKYKGYQIAPAELEEVLVSHPKVKDCCVIGIIDPKSGEELPKAFVVVDGNTEKPSLDEIKKYAHTKLAPYKHLRGGIEFINEIPKSSTGKILRRLIKNNQTQSQSQKSKL